jgi:peroxiredoxin Q/BCP
MTTTAIADFTADTTDGTFRLADQRGHTVVLYFYPKDNTPGCTTVGARFRDLHAKFAAAGATVVGVSRDSLKSHQGFQAKMGFPFPLISDPDEALCARFGVMKMKNMYGKQVRGIERSTFVIDSHGRLAREWRGVKVPGHVEEVLAFVQGLKDRGA